MNPNITEPGQQNVAEPVQPVNPSYSQPAQGAYAQPQVDPGKKLAIIGLILAFIVPIVGLILSIISRSKSKKAGFSGSMAIAGFFISVVTTIFSLIIGLSLVFAAYGAIQERAAESQNRSTSPSSYQTELN